MDIGIYGYMYTILSPLNLKSNTIAYYITYPAMMQQKNLTAEYIRILLPYP